MKKTLLNCSLFLLAFNSLNAQIDLIDEDENVITDGQEFSFGTIVESEAKLHFSIRNNTEQDINVQGKVVAIEGSDGELANFCMGQCLPTAKVGQTVPQGGYFVAANSTSDDYEGVYFLNMDDTNDYIKYTFKVYQIDQLGNEMGIPVHINYVYNANLSVNSNIIENTKIFPTVTNNNITISLQEEAEINIFNIQGKLVKSINLERGETIIDLSNQTAGIYLIQLKAANNSTVTKKIIKQQ